MKKILVATVKPFAPAAVASIQSIVEGAGFEFGLLEKYGEQADLVSAVNDVHALIIRSDKVTREVIEAGKELQIVVRAGAGYDNVDLEAATDNDVVVMNTPGQNSNAVAELAFGMMLYQARNHFNGTSGSELMGKTLGIHAFGNVGRRMAFIARGFGMEVQAYDPYIDSAEMTKAGATVAENVVALYSNADYLSINIPATPETLKSVNYELLSRMPVNAVLVNTARKEVLCEDSLQKILAEREDFAYISDIAPDCSEAILSKFGDRLFFTPKKMGAQTGEANINAGVAAANQIIGFLTKGDKTFQVNK